MRWTQLARHRDDSDGGIATSWLPGSVLVSGNTPLLRAPDTLRASWLRSHSWLAPLGGAVAGLALAIQDVDLRSLRDPDRCKLLLRVPHRTASAGRTWDVSGE